MKYSITILKGENNNEFFKNKIINKNLFVLSTFDNKEKRKIVKVCSKK